MTISVKTLAHVGTQLKRKAEQQHAPVDDDFLLPLYTYAHHPILQDLDEGDMRTVIEAIGNQALETHNKLDVQAINTTIRKICHPKNGFDLCHNAAQEILAKEGRAAAANQIKSKAADLRDALKKAGYR